MLKYVVWLGGLLEVKASLVVIPRCGEGPARGPVEDGQNPFDVFVDLEKHMARERKESASKRRRTDMPTPIPVENLSAVEDGYRPRQQCMLCQQR